MAIPKETGRELADKLHQAESTIKLIEIGKNSEFWKIIAKHLSDLKEGIENMANPYEIQKAPIDLARIQEIKGFLHTPDLIIAHAQTTKQSCLKKMGIAEAEEM